MFRQFWIVISFVLILWLTWVFQEVIITKIFGHEWESEKIGQLGDSFGILSSLFASIGAAAALYTLRMQQRQISKDQFDRTFFELLRMFGEARDRVQFSHSPSYLGRRSVVFPIGPFNRPQANKPLTSGNGVQAFQLAWVEIRHWMQDTLLTTKELTTIYEKTIHARSEDTLGPYFRLFYTILYRIKNEPNITEEEKFSYGNLVRGQLSQYEVALAGLNGLSNVSKDFRDLITYFRILKYTTGTRRKVLLPHYKESAFSGRSK